MTRLAALLFLRLLLLATHPSHADTIIVHGGAQFPGPQLYDVPGDTVSVAGTFTPFDPSLGVLRSVSVQRLFSLQAWVTLSDLEPGVYDGFLHSETQVFSADDTLIASSSAGHSYGILRTVLDDGSTPGDGTGVPFEVVFADADSLGGFEITNGLEFFQTNAPTTGLFRLTTRFYFEINGPLDGALFSADRSGGYLHIGGYDHSVSYNYTPVPEPDTALLVGMGLSVLGAVRSRGRGRNDPMSKFQTSIHRSARSILRPRFEPGSIHRDRRPLLSAGRPPR